MSLAAQRQEGEERERERGRTRGKEGEREGKREGGSEGSRDRRRMEKGEGWRVRRQDKGGDGGHIAVYVSEWRAVRGVSCVSRIPEGSPLVAQVPSRRPVPPGGRLRAVGCPGGGERGVGRAALPQELQGSGLCRCVPPLPRDRRGGVRCEVGLDGRLMCLDERAPRARDSISRRGKGVPCATPCKVGVPGCEGLQGW